MAVHSPDFYYIDPSKTASQTIQVVLREYYSAEPVKPPIMGWVPNKEQAIIVSVRNPYSRVVSLWWATCCRGGTFYRWEKYCDGILSMITWLRDRKWLLMADAAVLSCSPWNSNLCYTMTEWCCGLKPDYLIHQETIDEDFHKLPFSCGWPATLPKINVKLDTEERKPIEEYLTPDVIQAINEWCHDDFEQFGYTMRRS